MNLRSDRIYVAHREGLAGRLAQQERLGEARAEALHARWEAEAVRVGVDRNAAEYWPMARRWIAEQPGDVAAGGFG